MKRSRRDFIKASAVMGVLGASEASAQQRGRTRTTRARKLRLGDPRVIGVIHSTGFGQDYFRACFEQALTDNQWGPNKRRVLPREVNGHYGGSYGRDPLETEINNSRIIDKADVIVAAGGLISGTAAWDALMSWPVPFVYLIGSQPGLGLGLNPPPPLGKYCGVNLNTRQSYKDAVAALGVDPAKVYLVVNNNAAMAEAEGTFWNVTMNNNNVFAFFQYSHGNNDQNQYASEVARLQTFNPSGLVISSDPYFKSTAQRFTMEISKLTDANGQPIPVCYPFQQFLDFNPSKGQLLPKGASLSSSTVTDKNNAYYQLGLRVVDVLNKQTDQNPVPTSAIQSATWDSSTSTWKLS